MWHKGLYDGKYTSHSHLLDRKYRLAREIKTKPYTIILHVSDISVGGFSALQ